MMKITGQKPVTPSLFIFDQSGQNRKLLNEGGGEHFIDPLSSLR
jgi:hypothetical protein